MSFEKLGLAPEILSALKEESHLVATKIQELSIPKILEGCDLIATAQTGTGKTASFVLPILQALSSNTSKKIHKDPRVLILAPTRELAFQVHLNVEAYSKNLKVKSTVLCGGVDYKPQIEDLRLGSDIVVATPGRLIDLMDKRHIDLSHLEILVLDEADRMMDMGFMQAIKRIISSSPSTKQTLWFSATFSDVRLPEQNEKRFVIKVWKESFSSRASVNTYVFLSA